MISLNKFPFRRRAEARPHRRGGMGEGAMGRPGEYSSNCIVRREWEVYQYINFPQSRSTRQGVNAPGRKEIAEWMPRA
jgi:hypothetical protein